MRKRGPTARTYFFRVGLSATGSDISLLDQKQLYQIRGKDARDEVGNRAESGVNRWFLGVEWEPTTPLPSTNQHELSISIPFPGRSTRRRHSSRLTLEPPGPGPEKCGSRSV